MGNLSGSITPAQRYQYALNAGFNSADAIVMAAISMLECGNCDMSSVNKTGDSSLWQINSVHGYSVAWLADPQNSANAAYAVWKAQGFNAWCTYPGGCGGASTTTWAQFQGLISQVAASIQSAGGPANITLPALPIDATPSNPFPSTNTASGGGSGGFGDGGAPSSSTGSGTQVASIAGFSVNIPTGLVVGLLGVLLLLLGVLLFAFNVKFQPHTTTITPTGIEK